MTDSAIVVKIQKLTEELNKPITGKSRKEQILKMLAVLERDKGRLGIDDQVVELLKNKQAPGQRPKNQLTN